MDTQKTGRGGQKKNDVPPRLFSGPCAAGADGAVPAKAVDHTRAGTELDDIGPVRRAGPAGQTVGGYRAVRAEPGYGPLTVSSVRTQPSSPAERRVPFGRMPRTEVSVTAIV